LAAKKKQFSATLPTNKKIQPYFHDGWITDADIRKEKNATTTKYKKPFSKIQNN